MTTTSRPTIKPDGDGSTTTPTVGVARWADLALIGGGSLGIMIAVAVLAGWPWALLVVSVAAVALGALIR